MTERTFEQKLAGLHSIDGMTIRDWFAGQALAGLLAAQAFVDKDNTVDGTKVVAATFAFADAMLSQRVQP